MELKQAIEERRSIRKYKADMPARDVLAQVLEAARRAPSWANTQCWEFIVVTDPQLKKQLAETLPEKNPARPAIKQAPIVIAACARKGVSGHFKGQPATDKGDWLLFDVALALQNLTLMAHALGLGTVHTGFFDSRATEEILEAPPEVTVVELLPLGYPDGDARPTPRRPVEEWVSYERYGNRSCS